MKRKAVERPRKMADDKRTVVMAILATIKASEDGDKMISQTGNFRKIILPYVHKLFNNYLI